MNYKILTEDSIQKLDFLYHPEYNKDKSTNYFTSNRPKGILIYDSYNNNYFSYPIITIDKPKFDLPKYKQYLEKNYFGDKLTFLPFHFYIEFIDDDYYIFNTRPLTMKPLINPKDDYIEYIHICILGDSNTDIYDKSLYMKMKSLLNSLFILYKWGRLNKSKIKFKTGNNFVINSLFV